MVGSKNVRVTITDDGDINYDTDARVSSGSAIVLRCSETRYCGAKMPSRRGIPWQRDPAVPVSPHPCGAGPSRSEADRVSQVNLSSTEDLDNEKPLQ
jgi:hypothetical protein